MSASKLSKLILGLEMDKTYKTIHKEIKDRTI